MPFLHAVVTCWESCVHTSSGNKKWRQDEPPPLLPTWLGAIGTQTAVQDVEVVQQNQVGL